MNQDSLAQCATCTKRICSSGRIDEAQPNCPMITSRDILDKARVKYNQPQFADFARNASIQEAQCYVRGASGTTTVHPRVEETYLFARKMGYKRLGLAFCGGLLKEARVLNEILKNKGFEVVSVCCKCGSVDKGEIGVKPEEKIAKSDRFEAMCNPIAQAEILNAAGTEFNIMLGLCVGHDSLFLKNVDALTTVLVAKDRVTGHNPVAVLYTGGPYYRRIHRKEI